MQEKKTAKVSVPTKLILIGEHAVVYGSRGLAIPLPLLTEVSVLYVENSKIVVNIEKNQDVNVYNSIMAIIEKVCKLLEVPCENMKFSIVVEAPIGSGCGVSASLSIAILRAVSKMWKKSLSLKQEVEYGECLEKLNHGNPSGIDHTTVIYNTPILFQKQKNSMMCKKIDTLFHKNIFKHCYLVHTGKPKETTQEMVAMVKKAYQKNTRLYDAYFTSIDMLVPIIQNTCLNGDAKTFTKCINQCGEILEHIGVVSKNVENFSQIIRAENGACKISGAGGRNEASGVLFVYHENCQFVEELCVKNKMTFYKISDLIAF